MAPTRREEAMARLRRCLRAPISELYDSARYLDAAVTAHIQGNERLAGQLFKASDMGIVREWTESIWGANSIYVKPREVVGAPPKLPKEERVKERMPNACERSELIRRDGYHCRFCGVPVIRKEIRVSLRKSYPDSIPWGTKNHEQHAGFQALWLQFDHVVPHARGGDNAVSNIVITCAPCNYGRCDYLCEELGLLNPLELRPIASTWDGLERAISTAAG